MIGRWSTPSRTAGPPRTRSTWWCRRCRASPSARRSSTAAGRWRASPRTYDTLMRRLGYDSYGVHGSDGGAYRPASSASSTGRFPRPARTAAVLVPVRRPGRVREARAGVRRRTRACRGRVPGRRRVQHDDLDPSAERCRGICHSPVGLLAYTELFNTFGNGTSLLTPEPILTTSVRLVVRQCRRVPRATTAKTRTPAPNAPEPRPHRRRRVRRRLPDHPALGGTRQHEHRPLEPVRPGRALGGAEVPDGPGHLRTSSATRAESPHPRDPTGPARLGGTGRSIRPPAPQPWSSTTIAQQASALLTDVQ